MFWIFKHPRLLKTILNSWPPFFWCGIRIRHLNADYQHSRVELKWRPWTKNINRSQYGGSLYSMADPMFALMLYGILGGERYQIWDKSSHIDYIKPGIGRLSADFKISDAQIAEIKHHTEQGKKYFPEFEVEVKDRRREVVCRLRRTLYVRKRKHHR